MSDSEKEKNERIVYSACERKFEHKYQPRIQIHPNASEAIQKVLKEMPEECMPKRCVVVSEKPTELSCEGFADLLCKLENPRGPIEALKEAIKNYESECESIPDTNIKPFDPETETLRKLKDQAYAERNKLVAFVSKLFPASLERHPEDEDWDHDWRWIVFVDSPKGQLSWHIHDSELPLFDHLKRFQCRKWDGHSTEEKYRRLNASASIFQEMVIDLARKFINEPAKESLDV